MKTNTDLFWRVYLQKRGRSIVKFKYLETKAIYFLWKLPVVKIAIKCLVIVLLNKESAYHLKKPNDSSG